jgi:hypothetical protein
MPLSIGTTLFIGPVLLPIKLNHQLSSKLSSKRNGELLINLLLISKLKLWLILDQDGLG